MKVRELIKLIENEDGKYHKDDLISIEYQSTDVDFEKYTDNLIM